MICKERRKQASLAAEAVKDSNLMMRRMQPDEWDGGLSQIGLTDA